MNNKKFFVAALTSFFAFAVAATAANFSSTTVSRTSATTSTSHRIKRDGASYSASSFHAVELGRDELTVDVSSLTSTPESKSATLSFASSRLTGWGTPKKNAYIVIDDPDYSGTASSPSLSGNPKKKTLVVNNRQIEFAEFDGYTIEMSDEMTFEFSYTDSVTQEKFKANEYVLPEYLTYGDTFCIKNTKVLSNTFSFALDEHGEKMEKAKKFEIMIIPEGITEIESKAIQNVPTQLKIYCVAASKPAGWADDWCDANASQITWGYQLKGEETTGRRTNNEDSQLCQLTGSSQKYYGKLSKLVSDGRVYSNVTDVNWTGDYDNPVRTTEGIQTPYRLESTVISLEDDGSHEIYIPEEFTYSSSLSLVNSTISSKSIVLPTTKVTENVPELDEHGDPVLDSHGDPVTYEKKYDKYVGDPLAIYIPAGIETVESNAFSGLKYDTEHKVKIYCEAASKPGKWSDTWTDADSEAVFWGVAISDAHKVVAATSTSRESRVSSDAATYVLGYKYTAKDKYYCFDCDEYFYEEELVDGKCPHGHAVTKIEDKTPSYNLPLVVNYKIKNSVTHAEREVWHEMPLLSEEDTSSSTSYYDSVKTEPASRLFDILLDDLEENEEFDPLSVKVYNIYRQKSVKILTKVVEKIPELDEHGDQVLDADGKPVYKKDAYGRDAKQIVEKYLTYRIPDTKVSFSSSAHKRFTRETNVNEVVNYRFNGLTKFFGYSMISMDIDKVLPSYWFEGIDPSIVSSFKDKLDSGEFSIRYAIYNVNNSFYRLTYYSPTAGEDVTATIPVKTPNPVIILENDKANNVSYLIKNSEVTYKSGNKTIADFKIENLHRLELVSLTINIHLWNNKQSIKVGRTDLSIHFGAIDVMPHTTNNPGAYNVFTFILIFELILLAVYAAGAVVLFFVLKEKFKNDEFRRMKPKQYVKTAVLGYLGTFVISLTILFMAFRGGKFSNAVSVHNPLDVFIVIPGVISIVVIGYFIKFAVGKYKANKQRKVSKKLKLNEDAADDGTK